MDTITYSEARARFAKTLDKVCSDHAPVVITRRNAESVVMMSLDDYHAFEETAYLLRSPKNGAPAPSVDCRARIRRGHGEGTR